MGNVLAGACLVHLHLPRTGGTSLRRALLPRLVARMPPDRVFLVDMPPENGCSAGSFSELEALPPRERKRLRFVVGHLPPHVLEILPRFCAFTVLRSPVERALSDYWYCYHEPTNPAHEAARRLSPAEFCAAGYGQAANGQARYLSGVAFDGSAPTEARLFRRALTVLRKVHYVGLFEALPRAMADIAGLAGVARFGASERLNAAKRVAPVSAAERERIAFCNRVDQALHAWARRRVSKDIRNWAGGGDFR